MKAGARKLSWRTSTTWRSGKPSCFSGRSSRNVAEVRLIEFFGRRELPEQGAEPVAKLGHAGIEEALDGIRALGQHAAVGCKTAMP